MKRIFLYVIAIAMAVSVPTSIVGAAADDGNCDYIFKRSNGVRWNDPCSNVATCSTDAAGATVIANVSGEDNAEKIFNYLVAKGFSEAQAAGVVGNIEAESGFSPTRQESAYPFPERGWGLVQWTFGRRTDPRPNFGIAAHLRTYDGLAKYYAAQYGGPTSAEDGYKHPDIPMADNDKLIVASMDFVMKEIGRRTVTTSAVNLGLAKSGQSELQALKATKSAGDAARLWVYSFEIPAGIANTAAVRVENAKRYLAKFGSGGSASAGTAAVDGSCDDSATAGAALTGTSRDKIVQVAKAELEKWESGQLKRGDGSFRKYLQGNGPTNWCAYFVSWAYETAGVKIGDGNGAISTVSELKRIGQAGGKFTWHPAGNYTPKPGDLALYGFHVNLVVSASGPRNFTTIGGNELGGRTNIGYNLTTVYQNPSTTYWPAQAEGFFSISEEAENE